MASTLRRKIKVFPHTALICRKNSVTMLHASRIYRKDICIESSWKPSWGDYNLRNDIIWIKGFTILVIILALRNCWWSIRQYQMGGRWRERQLPWMMVSRIVIIWPECHCCWVFKKIFHPKIHSYEILSFLFFLSIGLTTPPHHPGVCDQLPPCGAGAGPNLVLITVHWPMVTRSPALAQVAAGSLRSVSKLEGDGGKSSIPWRWVRM